MKNYTVLTADGFRVGVLEGGEGTPLVFLHGFSVSASAYTEMLELLAANGFHVYALDAPDHGASDNLRWGHTMKDMAVVIDQALDELNMPDCVLVGHSMGGWLAAEVAAIFPESFSTLILLDSAVGTEFHENVRYTRHPSALGKAAQFFCGVLKDVFGDAVKAGSIRTCTERLRLMDILRGSVSGARCARAALAMMNTDSSAALAALKGTVRTVVIHGSHDGIVPVSAAWSAAKALECRIIILRGFHSWMISDPSLALEKIRDSLGMQADVPA